MKAQATRTTDTGIEISVTVIRTVIDRMWDGYHTGREYVESTEISFAKDGKVIGKGSNVDALWGKSKADMDAKARGAVGKVGNIHVGPAAVALIDEAIAEAEAAAPGDDEFWGIKQAAEQRKTEAEAAYAADADAIEAAERFERRMAAADSDL